MENIQIIKEIPDFPQEINPESDSIAIFIGAGVSRLIGCPGWDELSEKLSNRAFKDGIITYHEKFIIDSLSDNKLRIGSVYERYLIKNMEVDFYSSFKDIVDPDRTNSLVLSDNIGIYQGLKEFSKIFNRITYITTNSDQLFEDIYHIFEEEIIYPDPLMLEEEIKMDVLYRIHGSIKSGFKDSLVFTLQQYIDRYNNEKFQNFLSRFFKEFKYFLFIGYSLSELELLQYILAQNIQGGKKYWLNGYFKEEITKANLEANTYKSLGIEIIPYALDIRGFHQQSDIIKTWVSQLKLRNSTNINLIQQKIIDDVISEVEK